MTADRDTARVVRSWLRTDEHESADRILESVLSRLDSTPQRRHWPAWRSTNMSRSLSIAAAAAAVLIVAVAGYTLLPSLGGFGGPGGTPTATSTPAPTTTPVPSGGPLALPQGSSPGALAAGTYRAGPPFSVDVGFTVPAGWQGNVGGPYFAAVERAQRGTGGIYLSVLGNVYADACRTERGLASPSVGPSVDDLVTALTSLNGVTATTPVETTFAGHPATSFTLTPSGSPGTCTGGVLGLWQLPLGGVVSLSPGQQDRLWVLTVGATRLVVEVDGYTTQTPAMTAEVKAVLDSMTIAP
jgi:hypothetical protein